jgi:ferric-dicitrate binding protein FerR (iron transport regulator)
VGGVLASSAAIAVLAGLMWRGPWTSAPPAAPPAGTALARAVPGTNPLLVPYHQAGDGAPDAGASTSLLALRGERARATIGTRVRLTLVGPGRVSVLPMARAGEIDLAVDSGRLLVDYDGREGGALRVRSPGAVTTVVGTSFAVDVTPFGTRVGVAHGRVRTEDAAGHVWQVAAGDSWTSDGGPVRRLPADLASALAEHEAAWAGGLAAAPAQAQAKAAEPAEPRARTSRRAARAAAAADIGANVGVDLEANREANLDAIYAQAEDAMRRHATGEARRALETVAARDPAGPMGEVALLDLARLVLAEGDKAEARRILARLPARLHDAALAETAEHLRCRAARPSDAEAADGADPCR